MHLLAVQPGDIDGAAPVDLAQTPADVVFMSAADSELAALSEARGQMEKAPSLRLGNLAALRHPLSVDLCLDKCCTKSRLVILRLLGGAGYWQYGLEQFAIRLGTAGVPFAALPGDDKPDEELWHLSTVSREDWEALTAYMVEGGPENARNFLGLAKVLLDGGEKPPAARPLLRSGIYWPGAGLASLDALRPAWTDGAPVVPVIFYRALVQGAGLQPINRLVKALLQSGLNALPVFVASLKDPLSAATLAQIFAQAPPEVILNCTSFAVASPRTDDLQGDNPLLANDAPIFQVVLSGGTEEAWAGGHAGLSARDIAMNVALPEVDGRILGRAVSFKNEVFYDEDTLCPIVTYRAREDRIDFVVRLAKAWAVLRRTAKAERKVALVLANYPNRDGRLANGVGLDTPAATVNVLTLLATEGYAVNDVPADSDALMKSIQAGPTNRLTDRAVRTCSVRLSLDDYLRFYGGMPRDVRLRIEERWGAPPADPFCTDGAFALSILEFGNVVVGIQPARGYNVNPKDTCHAPDLVPPHNYIAFYAWLRQNFGAHVIVHMGKHGTLEWLPGKALALSEACFPEAVLGPVPHIYPFIVNDPGEGTQAKRRTQAVIIDHLTPPLTRAETYGPLKDLEALVDEYYEAAGVDPRRLTHLRREIFALTAATGMNADAGMDGADEDSDLARLDQYLCDLKEAQIRDGLHVFGCSPEGRSQRDLVQALVRVPRGCGAGADASLQRAIAQDLGLGFDPLDCAPAEPWQGPRPDILAGEGAWRTAGDTVERIEELAARLLAGQPAQGMDRTQTVLDAVARTIRPAVKACGPAELAGLLTALSGRFVSPAPSGAPTRGRLDTLPTGRNFFSVDSRAVPTPAAWALGWASANLLIERHLQDQGNWPRAILVTAWGTANMRTGGDDIAQALALMGVKPRWDRANRRVTGFDILPPGVLARPRVDVTLRVSGFFRDAFPQQMALFDQAARAVQALDEPADQNPAAATARAGADAHRVFGSRPGAYGAGLQAMIDERLWSDRADLGAAYIEWGGYAYAAGTDGTAAHDALRTRLGQVEAIVHNQDNREHDLLDSDDYYQFEGGASAAVASLQGRDRPIYHNDHSRPERPVIRTLDDEIGRVVRSRAVNPKWIEGVKRHGYKGAFEMAATLDYLFAFAATTGAVKNHHFDLVHQAFLEDEDTRNFISEANPAALREMAERLAEAINRGLWNPKSNSAQAGLDALLA
ncbi:MAG: cobaltochelatase subunit CobN [Rhodobacteraceae bacterium]|nr:cobaltochelatase subunit CobN [Paracoccaceae bacterium]